MRKTGFTLAELLIALVLLGLIATFTIPKILGSSDSSQKQAVFKETLSAIQLAFNQAVVNDEIRTTADYDVFKDYLNHVKACTPLCSSGCSHADQNRSNEPGLLLHNGATFCGLNSTFTANDVNENVSLDWNGPAEPNVEGDDFIIMKILYNPDRATLEFVPEPTSQALYDSIYE